MTDDKPLKDRVMETATRAAADRLLSPEALEKTAKRAIDSLTMTDEEKKARAATEEAAAKVRRVKWILGGVGALVVVVFGFRLIMKIWLGLAGLAVVGAVGYVAWVTIRPKLEAMKEKATARLQAARIEEERVADEERQRSAAQQKQQRLEDELAELKRKAGGA